MTIQLTGEKNRVVEKIQKRIDRFTESCQAFDSANKAVEDWTAKNVALAEIPNHEAQLQVLFDQLLQAANNLEYAADRIREKTDSQHIHKYFRTRYNFFKSYYTYISTGFKSTFRELNKTSTQLLATNYSAAIDQLKSASQRRIQDAQASIEYSLIDQTFPTCQHQLLMENPSEYLRQSLLFQNKLLEKKDAAGAIVFGTAWVKNIPKEATWDQIEHTSCILLEAAKAADQADLAEYRAGVEQWIKEHPSASPDSRRTLILGMLYFNEGLNTPEAFQVYQNCSALFPDQHAWKVAQAYYHISQHQGKEAEQLLAALPQDDPLVSDAQKGLAQAAQVWKIEGVYARASNLEHLAEAKQLLDELPQDNPGVLEAQKRLAEIHHAWSVAIQVHQAYQHLYSLEWVEAKQALASLPQDDPAVKEARETIDDSLLDRKISAVLDVGPTVLSWVTHVFRLDGPKAEAAQTALQLISNPPLRRKWIPFLFTTSRSVIPPAPSSSWITFGGDLADCIFRNTKLLKPFQSAESFFSSAIRMLNLTEAYHVNPQQRSLLSLMNLGSSYISARQAYDEWREIRRTPVDQALTFTCQKITSDVSTACTLVSVADLMPLIGVRPDELTQQLGIRKWTAKVLPGSSDIATREKWFFTALGITAILSKSVYQYPYEWASRVMKEAEIYYAKKKYEDVKQVFAESENTYFVSRSRGAVQSFASYLTWLIDNPQYWESSAYPIFLKRLNGALIALAGNSYYTSTRNRLLQRKLEAAIMMQDEKMLRDVLGENSDSEVANYGFNFLITHSLYLAHHDIAQARSIVKLTSLFPSHFHPTEDFLLNLLPHRAQFNIINLLQKPPAQKVIQQCNTAIDKLQAYLSAHDEKTGVYQDLQYYKLLLSLFQPNNTKQIEELFKDSDVQLHERLTNELILWVSVLWRMGDHNSAILLLKKVQFEPFRDKELIQKYCYFFSLLYIPDPSFEFPALDLFIESLKAEFQGFLKACRIVLYLDAGKSVEAKKLLAQELPDSKVPAEVAALLFERMYVSFTENESAKTLNALKEIEKLGPWQHQELFQTFQAYLDQKSLQLIETMIQQLSAIELPRFAEVWQELKFNAYLEQNKFQAANAFLHSSSQVLQSTLCTHLFLFLLDSTERLRQNQSPRKTLQQMMRVFTAADLTIFKNYLEFLVHLENIQDSKDLGAHQKTFMSLDTVIKQLDSIRSPIPATLQDERGKILSKIVFLANASGQQQTALEALETMKQLEFETKQNIQRLNKQKETDHV